MKFAATVSLAALASPAAETIFAQLAAQAMPRADAARALLALVRRKEP